MNKIRKERKVHFAYVVVDEAHCVSEWGHDFRTAYLRLGINAVRFCATRMTKLPLLALTGTASFDVLDDVKIELGYERDSEITVRQESMKRDNLKYQVVALKTPPEIPPSAAKNEMTIRDIIGKAKLASLPVIIGDMTQILTGLDVPAFINNDKGSGLVFCPHARNVHGAEGVQTALIAAFEEARDAFGVFHGSPEESRYVGFDPIKTQNDFKKGVFKVLACTKAFGMGIDKPDIRFTLHYNIPPSLESFYQEAGRSGRDGEESQCWILYAGTPMPGKDKQSLDYSLNHSFYTNAFPGAEIEEAKVFEMLDVNRVPGHSTLRDIEAMLFDNRGIEYTVKTYHQPVGDLHRIYINHLNYPDAKVFVNIHSNGNLSIGEKAAFPDHELISNLVIEWLNSNKPDSVSMKQWLFGEQIRTVNTGAGIEGLLKEVVGKEQVCLSLDNGYLEEIAECLHVELGLVRKAYSFVNDVEVFIGKLKLPKNNKQRDWIFSIFPKIRLQEHTFRAIYRLTILGAVDDFTVDYASKTVTATLHSQSPGKYREKLRDYIHRYAPQDVPDYLEVADQCDYSTELRCCLHALIQFVYGRIAKQRVAAMVAMERATKKCLEDPNALAETVTDYFDSPYIPMLRPYLNDYTSELVFEICNDTGAGDAKLKHLLGACVRLLEQNPNNAAFHAMLAYAYALLDYPEQDVKREIDAALLNFETYQKWGRKEKQIFLMRLRELIPFGTIAAGLVFDAVIIDDHASWLHEWNTTIGEFSEPYR